MTTFRYWVGILVVVSVPPAVVWWFVIHPFVAFWRRVGVRLTLTCVTLFYLAGVIGLYRWKSALLGADLGTSWLTVGAGLVLIIFAAVIAVRRKRELTWRILVGVPELEEAGGGRLLTTGLYTRLRHPRYVEVFLGVWGYALISNHCGSVHRRGYHGAVAALDRTPGGKGALSSDSARSTRRIAVACHVTCHSVRAGSGLS